MPRKKASRPKVKAKGKAKVNSKGKDQADPTEHDADVAAAATMSEMSQHRDNNNRKRKADDDEQGGSGSGRKNRRSKIIASRFISQLSVDELRAEGTSHRAGCSETFDIALTASGYHKDDDNIPRPHGFAEHTPRHVARLDVGTSFVGKSKKGVCLLYTSPSPRD